MTSDATLVSVEHVSRSFGHKTALDSVSLTVEPGTFAVLLGPSGSGKTTLLRLIAGIDRPSEGVIRFNETLVAGTSVSVPPEKRNLSMVFQDYALWPHLTVAQNVAFPLGRSRLGGAARNAKVSDLLGRVGIERLADRYPNELSGGEQQRVALARALIADVGLILFDEPLSNLDADRREALRIEIATLARDAGATVIYITHDQSEAFALADVVGVLSGGRLVQWATPEEVYQAPATPFVARFTGLAGEIPVLVTSVADGRADVQLRIGNGLSMSGCPTTCDVGAEATMFIRPSAISLRNEFGPGDIVGVVSDVAFVGRGYEHVVLLEGGVRLTKIAARSRFDRGSQVAVHIDPSAVNVLGDEDAE
jgi:iron(III) transport system ATP-binding protein